PEQAYRFLYPRLMHLYDPFLLKDMDKAVKRIYQAIVNQEKIVVYGDYDVDGLTGTAILYLFLSPLVRNLSYYIPHRLKEGYGLNPEAIKKIVAQGTDLLITTDCGSSDIEEVALANNLGLDVIIIDHHEVPSRLPQAYALVNPRQPDCHFPFKELAGVGVTFNLLIALRQFLASQGIWPQEEIPNLKAYLDLVALGTIADMVPLLDENRIFVKCGLEVLAHTSRLGLKELKAVTGLNHIVTPRDVAFRLAPRLNAAGRISTPHTGLRLLITDDVKEARVLAQTLHELNKERQRIEDQIWREAQSMLCTKVQSVLAKENWHPGVIGIVAGKLAEMFKRPILLISLDGESGRGSGRSVEGCDLFSALSQCDEYLEAYGGHKLAAGFSIDKENLEQFICQFEEVIKQMLEDRERPKLYIDAEVNFTHLTPCFFEYLSLLSPHGFGNPEPVFCASDLEIKHATLINERHLKILVTQQNLAFEAIGFNLASLYPPPNPLKMAFVPYEDYWQDKRLFKLKIQALKGI
ncbi:MAG: single-stranded-DNA-specific exonuclease RecJ, partial [Candidatus Desulfofervidaceae bacterium]|nr:single-stranded-DNA-specific exonuclease RecJ [Candidatus Desulfofervidaceae bacterium]